MSQFTDDQQSELDALILRGKKIQAIKLYRELTDAGLAEAKDAVEARATQLRVESPQAVQTPADPRGPSVGVWRVVDGAIYAGRPIRAIELYRELTGAGLKEAKDRVDARQAELERRCEMKFPSREKEYITMRRKGCMGVLAIALILAAGIWAAVAMAH